MSSQSRLTDGMPFGRSSAWPLVGWGGVISWGLRGSEEGSVDVGSDSVEGYINACARLWRGIWTPETPDSGVPDPSNP